MNTTHKPAEFAMPPENHCVWNESPNSLSIVESPLPTILYDMCFLDASSGFYSSLVSASSRSILNMWLHADHKLGVGFESSSDYQTEPG